MEPFTRHPRERIDSLTGELALKIENLLAGVQSQAWAVLLRDWDRSLRAGNHPETARYNYALAASQLAAYLGERMPEVDGAYNPSLVDSRQVTAFQSCSAKPALGAHGR